MGRPKNNIANSYILTCRQKSQAFHPSIYFESTMNLYIFAFKLPNHTLMIIGLFEA